MTCRAGEWNRVSNKESGRSRYVENNDAYRGYAPKKTSPCEYCGRTFCAMRSKSVHRRKFHAEEIKRY